MTTEQGNEIIAKYFNTGYWQAWKIGGYKPRWVDQYRTKELCEAAIEAYHVNIQHDLEAKFISPDYHNDWALMMPLVVEIEKGNYGIKQCRKVVEIYYDDTKEIIIKEKHSNRMESLWHALVNFIKWKNENNK